jgi:hypothetical protein
MKPERKYEGPTTVRLTADIARRLKVAAKDAGVSRSQMLRAVLLEGLIVRSAAPAMVAAAEREMRHHPRRARSTT